MLASTVQFSSYGRSHARRQTRPTRPAHHHPPRGASPPPGDHGDVKQPAQRPFPQIPTACLAHPTPDPHLPPQSEPQEYQRRPREQQSHSRCSTREPHPRHTRPRRRPGHRRPTEAGPDARAP